jgi:hypothetical protein
VSENRVLRRIYGHVGHVSCTGEMRNKYKILDRKPEGKRPLRRQRHRWEDSIRGCRLDASGSE